ncbi:Aste57867_23306 [Aphanomyces stellatus]|uniref:Aste57867_23306 protein n=1 Tax=Aphanomyces stellatus TaxID=120398 RepID=A0A485LNF2_9STRA|nr:hypothetical protein As57867_023235 [Aphanomyces stellatus]VFT99951.1 Aste57867_23306 [Aphanomyces stellatus]
MNEEARPRFNSDTLSVFTFNMHCPLTKQRWALTKRFPQFVSLHQQLTALHNVARFSADLEPIERILTPFLALALPKKPLSSDSDDEIWRRERTFKRMTALLMTMRQACVVQAPWYHPAGRVRPELMRVADILQDFLAVPTDKQAEMQYTSFASVLPIGRHESPFAAWLVDSVQTLASRWMTPAASRPNHLYNATRRLH